MKTLEEVKSIELHKLQEALKLWEADPRGLADASVKHYTDQIKNQVDHFEELIQIQIAHQAHSLVSLLSNPASRNYNMETLMENIGSLGFSKEDELVKALMNTPTPEAKRTEFVQAVYEDYGYTDILPSLDQIRELEAQSKNEALSEEERKVAQQELMKAQRKLGIGNFSGGNPISFPSEIVQDVPSTGFTM